jgi:hypothetical protein
LGWVVVQRCSKQYIGIGDNSHRRPPLRNSSTIASPIASFISSIVNLAPLVLPFRQPANSLILPFFNTARPRISPPGNISISSFSPGLIPTCCRISFLRVTCPREVVVTIAKKITSAWHCNADLHYVELSATD